MENVQLRLIDRISNLPDNVMESILILLPIREAVRSSILSRKWRYVWTKLPQLVLDKTLWKNVANGKKIPKSKLRESPESTLKKVLYQLLLCHDGPINKFTLSYPDLGSCTEIDNLIFFLAKSHVEDFTLEMWKEIYSLPYSIFSCQKLRHLRLKLCSIKSFASVGFSRLTSLKLFEVSISAETLARLISGSPLLDLLEIENYSSDVDICIDAPNLRTLEVRGLIKSINFKRVPFLDWLLIHTDHEHDDIVDFIGVERSIAKFFGCLPALETLQLTSNVAESFGDEVPKRIQTSLILLKDLSLCDIGFNRMIELLFTLCLLRSSPILEYIQIEFEDYPDSTSEEATSYMEMEDFSDICLSELIEVTLSNVMGTKPELEFIRLLLAKSSVLKKIQIQFHRRVDVGNGLKILKEVTKFRRISKEAEIIFDE